MVRSSLSVLNTLLTLVPSALKWSNNRSVGPATGVGGASRINAPTSIASSSSRVNPIGVDLADTVRECFLQQSETGSQGK
jgi:hypothetical protein